MGFFAVHCFFPNKRFLASRNTFTEPTLDGNEGTRMRTTRKSGKPHLKEIINLKVSILEGHP